MSGVDFNKGREASRSPVAGPVMAILAAALLSGCAFAKRDSVIVGSVPDDYRTNHPIVISENDETLDLPVAVGAKGMTKDQAETLAGFLTRYDRGVGGTLTIMAPTGSSNAAAATETAWDFADFARRNGVPAERISVLSYQAPASDVAAPIRISYPVVSARTNQCGRWPEDILETTENKHYANFGCSYQNNLAAQIANPNDFLGPRKQTPIDAENRDAAIIDYKGRKVTEGFRGKSEVHYD